MAAVFVESALELYEGDDDVNGDGKLSRAELLSGRKHGWMHIWRRHWESVVLLAVVSAVKLAFCTWCEIVVRGKGWP